MYAHVLSKQVQFVYEPHIAPALERFSDELTAAREVRRRQRAGSDGDMDMSVELSASAVRDYTRSPRDDDARRRAAAAAAWRRLTDSVSELDSLRGEGSGVAAPATDGLRRRAPGPMDAVRIPLSRAASGAVLTRAQSIESLLFDPLPRALTPTRAGADTLFSAPSSPRSVRSPAPEHVDTLFSAATSPRSASPALTSLGLPYPASPRSPGADSLVSVASSPRTAPLDGPRSPDPFSDAEANPWAHDDDVLSISGSAVFLSPAVRSPAADALAGSDFFAAAALSPAAGSDALAGSDFFMPAASTTMSPPVAALDVLSPFTHALSEVDDLEDALSLASLSDSDSDGDWADARRDAHL
jgi:hypothetical protein